MKLVNLPTYDISLSITEAIVQAKSNPIYLPGLYYRLLKEDLLVIINQSNQEGYYTSSFGTNVSILQLENQKIPVFTDEKQIYKSGVITEEVDYMKVHAQSFFELMVGCDLIINPFSSSAFNLSAKEVSDIVDHSFYFAPNTVTGKTKYDKKLNLVQQVPNDFILTLNQYLATITDVEKAYIATLLDPKIESKPHYILALVCPKITKPTFAKIIDKVSKICAKKLPGQSFIEMIKLTEDHTYNSFFTIKTTPFYTKKGTI